MISSSSLSLAPEVIRERGQKMEPSSDNQDASDCNLVQTTTLRSNIVDFYHNRSVLITGGSGFIGKVLIEKLLRSCGTIRHIFVLIRPKWNKQPHERIKELLNVPLFDEIRKSGILEKVLVVEGDVTQSNLGLSESNLLRIMNEVSVIFHSAATVKFDEPLKQSVNINITGTKNMIELCRKIPQLAALVHISTAYANCDRKEIDEHIYPVDMSPEKLIEMANWLEQDTMQELKIKLLRNRPNTYTYTKASAEWLLFECARDLPVVICRPSIVTASWKEPFSGWIDNVNGPTGIILGAGKGIIRSMFGDSKCVADLVPVDTVINLIITLGWFADVYQNNKQMNDTAESLTESMIGSSSGDESLDGYTDQLGTLVMDKNRIRTELLQNTSGDPNDNTMSGSNRNNNYRKVLEDVDSYNNNNNNNNHSSNGNFHTTGYGVGQAKSKSGVKIILTNNNDKSNFDHKYHHSNNVQQYSDDGYGSAIHSPATNSTTSISSSSLGNNQPHSNAITSISETLAINHNQIENDHKVLSLVAQRRLAEQKHAAFEYKLKQFRHNQQVRLAAQNLPEDIADIPVFHCTSGSQNPITWLRIQQLIMTIVAMYPSISTYRYPSGAFTNIKFVDDFYRITLHYIPGYIVDFITRLFGGKPVLIKIFRKYDQAASVLKTFTSNEWKFDIDNRLMLINELMSEEDRRLFDFDLKPLDWEDFLTGYVLGVRRFMLKEPIETLEQARNNLKVVYYRNLSLQLLFFAILVYQISKIIL